MHSHTQRCTHKVTEVYITIYRNTCRYIQFIQIQLRIPKYAEYIQTNELTYIHAYPPYVYTSLHVNTQEHTHWSMHI